MKIYISADIEGISGVTDWAETMGSDYDALKARQQMTKEVGAACFGACEGGATEILVKDAHSSGRNIDPADLPTLVSVHRGWSEGPLRMMEGLDASFDAVVFIGYHSGANMFGGPLAHTFSSRKFQEIFLNGQRVSEFDINSFIASYYQVPVVFVSGDEALCESIERRYPYIKTLSVLKGIGNSNISIHPEKATEDIRAGVEKALLNKAKKDLVPLPEYFEFKIVFKEAKDAYKASFYPEVVLEDSKTIVYETHDFMSFLKMFLFI